ncbi:hypothetical protein N7462_008529 [Penicillium macrosclerotiorum]|uniref:uncharacterized protein n=1 Tax=Penicillium macrosclerotiorum TaxID=303699 RepID=UPI002549239B|nr:uncharacterized protein N7462_008529 [Penicillium macrosclerotiorum]KAJ5675632.1 hypothetical protein N7462_008529 [Penicillium macrosclerotiorum]
MHKTPLHLAIEFNILEVFRWLKLKTSPLDLCPIDRSSPLWDAVASVRDESVTMVEEILPQEPKKYLDTRTCAELFRITVEYFSELALVLGASWKRPSNPAAEIAVEKIAIQKCRAIMMKSKLGPLRFAESNDFLEMHEQTKTLARDLGLEKLALCMDEHPRVKPNRQKQNRQKRNCYRQ